MAKDLKIGISGLGVLHTDSEVPSIDTKFKMVKESGAFDYLERTPSRNELAEYLSASNKHGVPMPSGGFCYMIGHDKQLLETNLATAKECGSNVHNVQIFAKDANGRYLTDADIVDILRMPQGVHHHKSLATGTNMTFSVYVLPGGSDETLPVTWYLSGLTCTHANVTEKGESDERVLRSG